MELKNKKIAFLGDSITEGHGVSEKKNIYWNQVGERTGAQVYGYGIGGTRIAVQKTPSENPKHDRHFASRVEEMIQDADMVVVFGGTNDFGHGDAPLGSMEDRKEDSFYGAYHLLLQKLIYRYPAAQLVVMTPLHRGSEDDDGWNSNGIRRAGTLKRYVQAIREVAEYYGVPVIDLYATCSIQPKIALQKQMYMPDGLHPNDAGHAIIADRVCGARLRCEALEMNGYLYETHLHTAEASLCGKVPAAEMVRKFKAAGYTGVVITDHFYWGNTAIDRKLPWEQWVEDFCKGYENAKAEGDKIGLQVFLAGKPATEGSSF